MRSFSTPPRDVARRNPAAHAAPSPRATSPRAAAPAITALALAAASAAGQTTAVWQSDTGGAWDVGTNWSTGQRPANDGVDRVNVVIDIPGAGNTDYTIALATPVEIDDFTLASDNATLDLAGTTLSVLSLNATAGRITGAGASELRVRGDADIIGIELFSLATLTLDAAATVTDAVFNGVQSATFAGDTTFTGSTLFLGSAATLNANTTVCDDVDVCDSDVDNFGAITLDDSASFRIDAGGTFAVRAGGSLNVTGDTNRAITGTGATNTFINQGTVTKSGAGELRLTNLTLQSEGRFDVNAGLLALADDVQGLITSVADGDRLEGGEFRVADNAGLALEGADIVELAANVELIGANSTFAQLDGVERVDSEGRLALSGGRAFTTQGDFEVIGTGTLAVGAGSTFTVNGTLVNLAAGRFSGGQFEVSGLLRAADAAINQIAGNLTVGATAAFQNLNGDDALSSLNLIEAPGRLNVLAGAALTTTGPLTVAGTLRLASTAAVGRGFPEPLPPGGTNRGGLVVIAGDYIQQIDSTLAVRIRGANDFGVLHIEGDAVFGSIEAPGLAGTLLVELDAAGLFEVGDIFEIIRVEGSILGFFADVRVVAAGRTALAEVRQVGGSFFVVIVPAPASAPLLAAAGLLAARRRRRA